MSTKGTLFLTNDNEHFYEECLEPHYKGDHYPALSNNFDSKNFIGYTITLEMSKKNIAIVCNDKEDLIIELKPGSELYSLMMKMKDGL